MTNSIDQHVGARLRYLRQSRGMNVEALAGLLSISVDSLNGLEDGRERISADMMRRLSRALRAAPSEFFEGFSITALGLVRLTDDDARAADEEARLTRDFARIRDENARQLILSMVSNYAVFAEMAKS